MQALLRKTYTSALAVTVGVTILVAPAAQAQMKKVRYSEVVRSLFYAPAYVALSKGYFKAEGLDVSMTTAQGGDKSVAALLSSAADIALVGPEVAVYVKNSESPTKLKIFAGLTATDGFILMARHKTPNFDWKMLKGKDILGWRQGSTPTLFLDEVLRMHGLNPARDVNIANNVAVPARVGSWLSGQNQFGIFQEPDVSTMERDGTAFGVASDGKEVGPIDYTVFVATDKYIHDNPVIIQKWTNAIYKAEQWTASASPSELGKTLQEFFPGVDQKILVSAAQRYKTLNIWKTTPVIEPQAMTRFQDVLVNGKVLDNAKRVKFEDIVNMDFARKAK
jgi:NitT/TauT family transport system substrate-binding protein